MGSVFESGDKPEDVCMRMSFNSRVKKAGQCADSILLGVFCACGRYGSRGGFLGAFSSFSRLFSVFARRCVLFSLFGFQYSTQSETK